jgi:hypothetical protein
MPFPNQIDPKGVFAPAARTPVGAAVGAPAPAGGMFTTLDYRPNHDVAGGALSRGGPDQMTALDLSQIFGGARAEAPAEPKKSVSVTRPDEPKKKDWPLPPKRPKDQFKSSSTSQGGGY